MPRFQFSDNANDLRRLAALTRRGTPAEVVRDALALYDHLIKRRLEGDRLFLGASKSKSVELRVTTLEAAAKL